VEKSSSKDFKEAGDIGNQAPFFQLSSHKPLIFPKSSPKGNIHRPFR